MATRRKVETSITDKLENQLQPFFNECERRGYPISEFWFEEAIPGLYDSFALRCVADWTRNMGPFEYLPLLDNILYETTPEDVCKLITIVVHLSPEMMEQVRAENLAKTRVAV